MQNKNKTKTKLDQVVIISDFAKPRISIRKCVKWVAEERNSIHFVNKNKEVLEWKWELCEFQVWVYGSSNI